MPKVKDILGEQEAKSPTTEKEAERAVKKEKVTKESKKPVIGEGEVFFHRWNNGRPVNCGVLITMPEETIVGANVRVTKPGVIAQFVESVYTCKSIPSMKADEISKRLKKHQSYGIKFWSLTDVQMDKDKKAIVSGKGLSCPYCHIANFRFRTEYEGHVSACEKLHSETYHQQQIKELKEKVSKEPYNPSVRE